MPNNQNNQNTNNNQMNNQQMNPQMNNQMYNQQMNPQMNNQMYNQQMNPQMNNQMYNQQMNPQMNNQMYNQQMNPQMNNQMYGQPMNQQMNNQMYNQQMNPQMNNQMYNQQMNPQMNNQMYGQPMNQPMNNQMYNQPMNQPMNNQMYGQPMNQQMNNQMYGQPMYNQPMNQPMYKQPKESPIKKDDVVNFFKYILNALYKPISTFKENSKKFNSPKNSVIFSSIILGIAMVLNVIVELIRHASAGSKTSAVVKSLGINANAGMDWFGETIKFLLIYAVVVYAIAGIFTLASLIVKKKVNYMKVVAIISTALIPYIAANFIVGPILGIIFSLLGMICTIVGLLYTIVIFTDLITTEMEVTGNKKVHLLVICYSITIILFVILFIATAANALQSSGLGSLGKFNFGSFLK